jgi:cytidine deaminase
MTQDPLIAAARSARGNAYAPYSGYLVGAAVETPDGSIYVGGNVENVSFGATICAERSAIASMVSAGGRQIRRLALVTVDGATPCGICLQVMAEFAEDNLPILIADEAGNVIETSLRALFPAGFHSKQLGTY